MKIYNKSKQIGVNLKIMLQLAIYNICTTPNIVNYSVYQTVSHDSRVDHVGNVEKRTLRRPIGF